MIFIVNDDSDPFGRPRGRGHDTIIGVLETSLAEVLMASKQSGALVKPLKKLTEVSAYGDPMANGQIVIHAREVEDPMARTLSGRSGGGEAVNAPPPPLGGVLAAKDGESEKPYIPRVQRWVASFQQQMLDIYALLSEPHRGQPEGACRHASPHHELLTPQNSNSSVRPDEAFGLTPHGHGHSSATMARSPIPRDVPVTNQLVAKPLLPTPPPGEAASCKVDLHTLLDMLHACGVFIHTNSAGEVVEESNHTGPKLPAAAMALHPAGPSPSHGGSAGGVRRSPLGYVSKKQTKAIYDMCCGQDMRLDRAALERVCALVSEALVEALRLHNKAKMRQHLKLPMREILPRQLNKDAALSARRAEGGVWL